MLRPSSLAEQRKTLQRYIWGLQLPLSDKQRANRQERLEEYIHQLLTSLLPEIPKIYRKQDIENTSGILNLIAETGKQFNPTQLQHFSKQLTARLYVYQQLTNLVKELWAQEYRLGRDQKVIDIIQKTSEVIEYYHQKMFIKESLSGGNNEMCAAIRYAMSDEITQELHRLYTAGRPDRSEVLTSLFQVYFHYLESQGKRTSIHDVKQIMVAILHDEGKTAEVNTLFVEKEVGTHDDRIHQERVIVEAVRVNIFEKGTGKITTNIHADECMQNAVRGALIASVKYLQTWIDPAMTFEMFDYSWSISDDSKTYKQDSLGLSVAIAAIAAYVGRDVDPGIAVTGKIDRAGTICKVKIERKCTLDDERIHTLILPEENRADLPVGLKRQITTVRTLEEAVEAVLGKENVREMILSRYKSYKRQLHAPVRKFFSQVATNLYDPQLYIPRQGPEAQIDQFLKSLQTCLVVTGDAGMGKTNLLYHLCQQYQAQGHLLFIEDCTQLTCVEEFIREIIDTVDRTAPVETIFSRLNQLADFTHKKVIIILDALNEKAEQAGDWFRFLKKLTVTLTHFQAIKLIISCKTNTWNRIQETVNGGKVLPPEIYQILSVEEFSSEELRQIEHRLSQGTLPNICRYPFLVRILHTVYISRQNKIPKDLSIITLFREYMKTLTREIPEIQLLLQVMIAEFRNIMTSKQGHVYDIPYTRLMTLYNEQLKGQVFSKFTELLNKAKDNSLLIEVRTAQSLSVRFRFDWLVEYLLGGYLYEKEFAPPAPQHLNKALPASASSRILVYLRNKQRSPFLEGAIKYIFLLANSPELFLMVARDMDDFDDTLLSTTLLWHREDPHTVLVLLSHMIGKPYTTIRADRQFTHTATYLQVLRVLVSESIQKVKMLWRRMTPSSPPRITEARYSVALFALKIASLLGHSCVEILLFAVADRHTNEQFRQKAVDYLGNVYNQATTAEQIFILEKSFAFTRTQTDLYTIHRLIYFMMRAYMHSYEQPEIVNTMGHLLANLLQGFGQRPLILAGRSATKLFLDKISNRESDIYETFLQRPDKDRVLQFLGLLDDAAHPAKDDIEPLEQFILEVGRSDIPERFVYFYLATRILFFCGVKNFTVVKDSLIRLYDALPYTTRDLIPGVLGLIYRNHPTEETFQVLESISWKIIERDREYLIKGGHEENNMYYPLTPIGRASGERQGDQPAPPGFFVQVICQALAEQNWGLLNHYLRELGTIGYNHPESVLLTLQSLTPHINPETKATFIRALAAIHLRFPDLAVRFLQEHLDEENPYTPDIRRGVIIYEDDGSLQRMMDSSILYDFFTLMFVKSQTLRLFLIDIGRHVNDFQTFDALIEYGLSRLFEILSHETP